MKISILCFRLQKMQHVLFVYCLTSVNGCTVPQLRADWQVDGILMGCQVGMVLMVWLLKELKHGIVFVRMLLENEFIVTKKKSVYTFVHMEVKEMVC